MMRKKTTGTVNGSPFALTTRPSSTTSSTSSTSNRLPATGSVQSDPTQLSDAALSTLIAKKQAEEKQLRRRMQQQEQLLAPSSLLQFSDATNRTKNATWLTDSEPDTSHSSRSSPDDEHYDSAGTSKSHGSNLSASSSSTPEKTSLNLQKRRNPNSVTFLLDAQVPMPPLDIIKSVDLHSLPDTPQTETVAFVPST